MCIPKPALLVGLALMANGCADVATGPNYESAADAAHLESLAQDATVFADITLGNVYEVRSRNLPLYAKGPSAVQARREFADAYLRGLVMASRAWPGAGDTPFTAPLAMAAPNQECEPIQSGVDAPWDWKDADANGIPDDWTVDYGTGCVNTDSSGTVTERYAGSYRIQQVSGVPFGYTITATRLSVTFPGMLGDGHDFTASTSGSETFAMSPGRADHTQNSVVSTTQVGETDAAIVKESSFFVPDSGAVLGPDLPLPAGHFSYTSDIGLVGYDAGGGSKGDRIVVTTPTPLRYDPACDSRYTGGAMRGLLNGQQGVGFEATWSGCGAPLVGTFGATP